MFRVLIVLLSLLFLTGCQKYPQVFIEGTVVAGRFEPSQLGSGDKYFLTLESCLDPANAQTPYRYCRENDPAERIQKTVIFQWPDSTRMLEQADFPLKGERWKLQVTNPYHDHHDSELYVPFWGEVRERHKNECSRTAL